MEKVELVEFAALGNDIWRGTKQHVDLHQPCSSAVDSRRANLTDCFTKDVADFLQIPTTNVKNVVMGRSSLTFDFIAYHAIALMPEAIDQLLQTANFHRTMRAYYDAGRGGFQDRIRLPGEDWKRLLHRHRSALEAKAREDLAASFAAAQALKGDGQPPEFTIKLAPAKPTGANLFFASVDNPTPVEKERRREVLGLTELVRTWDLYHHLVTGEDKPPGGFQDPPPVPKTSDTPTAKGVLDDDTHALFAPQKLIPSWMSKWDTDSDDDSRTGSPDGSLVITDEHGNPITAETIAKQQLGVARIFSGAYNDFRVLFDGKDWEPLLNRYLYEFEDAARRDIESLVGYIPDKCEPLIGFVPVGYHGLLLFRFAPHVPNGFSERRDLRDEMCFRHVWALYRSLGGRDARRPTSRAEMRGEDSIASLASPNRRRPMSSSRSRAGASVVRQPKKPRPDRNQQPPLPRVDWKYLFVGKHWNDVFENHYEEMMDCVEDDIFNCLRDGEGLTVEPEIRNRLTPRGDALLLESMFVNPSEARRIPARRRLFVVYLYPCCWGLYYRLYPKEQPGRAREDSQPLKHMDDPGSPLGYTGSAGSPMGTSTTSPRRKGAGSSHGPWANRVRGERVDRMHQPKLERVDWKYNFQGKHWEEVFHEHYDELMDAVEDDIFHCLKEGEGLLEPPMMSKNLNVSPTGLLLQAQFDTPQESRQNQERRRLFKGYVYPRTWNLYYRLIPHEHRRPKQYDAQGQLVEDTEPEDLSRLESSQSERRPGPGPTVIPDSPLSPLSGAAERPHRLQQPHLEDVSWKYMFQARHWEEVFHEHYDELMDAVEEDIGDCLRQGEGLAKKPEMQKRLTASPKGLLLECKFVDPQDAGKTPARRRIFTSYMYPKTWRLYYRLIRSERQRVKKYNPKGEALPTSRPGSSSRSRMEDSVRPGPGLSAVDERFVHEPAFHSAQLHHQQKNRTTGSVDRIATAEQGPLDSQYGPLHGDRLKIVERPDQLNQPVLQQVDWKYYFEGKHWEEVYYENYDELMDCVEEDVFDCLREKEGLEIEPRMTKRLEASPKGLLLQCKFDEPIEKWKRQARRKMFKEYLYPWTWRLYYLSPWEPGCQSLREQGCQSLREQGQPPPGRFRSEGPSAPQSAGRTKRPVAEPLLADDTSPSKRSEKGADVVTAATPSSTRSRRSPSKRRLQEGPLSLPEESGEDERDEQASSLRPSKAGSPRRGREAPESRSPSRRQDPSSGSLHRQESDMPVRPTTAPGVGSPMSPGRSTTSSIASPRRPEDRAAGGSRLDDAKSVPLKETVDSEDWRYLFVGRIWQKILDKHAPQLDEAARIDITDALVANKEASERPEMKLEFSANAQGLRLKCFAPEMPLKRRPRRRKIFHDYFYPNVWALYRSYLKFYSSKSEKEPNEMVSVRRSTVSLTDLHEGDSDESVTEMSVSESKELTPKPMASGRLGVLYWHDPEDYIVPIIINYSIDRDQESFASCDSLPPEEPMRATDSFASCDERLIPQLENKDSVVSRSPPPAVQRPTATESFGSHSLTPIPIAFTSEDSFESRELSSALPVLQGQSSFSSADFIARLVALRSSESIPSHSVSPPQIPGDAMRSDAHRSISIHALDPKPRGDLVAEPQGAAARDTNRLESMPLSRDAGDVLLGVFPRGQADHTHELGEAAIDLASVAMDAARSISFRQERELGDGTDAYDVIADVVGLSSTLARRPSVSFGRAEGEPQAKTAVDRTMQQTVEDLKSISLRHDRESPGSTDQFDVLKDAEGKAFDKEEQPSVSFGQDVGEDQEKIRETEVFGSDIDSRNSVSLRRDRESPGGTDKFDVLNNAEGKEFGKEEQPSVSFGQEVGEDQEKIRETEHKQCEPSASPRVGTDKFDVLNNAEGKEFGKEEQPSVSFGRDRESEDNTDRFDRTGEREGNPSTLRELPSQSIGQDRVTPIDIEKTTESEALDKMDPLRTQRPSVSLAGNASRDAGGTGARGAGADGAGASDQVSVSGELEGKAMSLQELPSLSVGRDGMGASAGDQTSIGGGQEGKAMSLQELPSQSIGQDRVTPIDIEKTTESEALDKMDPLRTQRPSVSLAGNASRDAGGTGARGAGADGAGASDQVSVSGELEGKAMSLQELPSLSVGRDGMGASAGDQTSIGGGQEGKAMSLQELPSQSIGQDRVTPIDIEKTTESEALDKMDPLRTQRPSVSLAGNASRDAGGTGARGAGADGAGASDQVSVSGELEGKAMSLQELPSLSVGRDGMGASAGDQTSIGGGQEGKAMSLQELPSQSIGQDRVTPIDIEKTTESEALDKMDPLRTQRPSVSLAGNASRDAGGTGARGAGADGAGASDQVSVSGELEGKAMSLQELPSLSVGRDGMGASAGDQTSIGGGQEGKAMSLQELPSQSIGQDRVTPIDIEKTIEFEALDKMDPLRTQRPSVSLAGNASRDAGGTGARGAGADGAGASDQVSVSGELEGKAMSLQELPSLSVGRDGMGASAGDQTSIGGGQEGKAMSLQELPSQSIGQDRVTPIDIEKTTESEALDKMDPLRTQRPSVSLAGNASRDAGGTGARGAGADGAGASDQVSVSGELEGKAMSLQELPSLSVGRDGMGASAGDQTSIGGGQEGKAMSLQELPSQSIGQDRVTPIDIEKTTESEALDKMDPLRTQRPSVSLAGNASRDAGGTGARKAMSLQELPSLSVGRDGMGASAGDQTSIGGGQEGKAMSLQELPSQSIGQDRVTPIDIEKTTESEALDKMDPLRTQRPSVSLAGNASRDAGGTGARGAGADGAGASDQVSVSGELEGKAMSLQELPSLSVGRDGMGASAGDQTSIGGGQEGKAMSLQELPSQSIGQDRVTPIDIEKTTESEALDKMDPLRTQRPSVSLAGNASRDAGGTGARGAGADGAGASDQVSVSGELEGKAMSLQELPSLSVGRDGMGASAGDQTSIGGGQEGKAMSLQELPSQSIGQDRVTPIDIEKTTESEALDKMDPLRTQRPSVSLAGNASRDAGGTGARGAGADGAGASDQVSVSGELEGKAMSLQELPSLSVGRDGMGASAGDQTSTGGGQEGKAMSLQELPSQSIGQDRVSPGAIEHMAESEALDKMDPRVSQRQSMSLAGTASCDAGGTLARDAGRQRELEGKAMSLQERVSMSMGQDRVSPAVVEKTSGSDTVERASPSVAQRRSVSLAAAAGRVGGTDGAGIPDLSSVSGQVEGKAMSLRELPSLSVGRATPAVSRDEKLDISGGEAESAVSEPTSLPLEPMPPVNAVPSSRRGRLSVSLRRLVGARGPSVEAGEHGSEVPEEEERELSIPSKASIYVRGAPSVALSRQETEKMTSFSAAPESRATSVELIHASAGPPETVVRTVYRKASPAPAPGPAPAPAPAPAATAAVAPRVVKEDRAVSPIDCHKRVRVGFQGIRWPHLLQKHREAVLSAFIQDTIAALASGAIMVDKIKAGKEGLTVELSTLREGFQAPKELLQRLNAAPYTRIWRLYKGVRKTLTTFHRLGFVGEHWPYVLQGEWDAFFTGFVSDTADILSVPLTAIRVTGCSLEHGAVVDFYVTHSRKLTEAQIDTLLSPQQFRRVWTLYYQALQAKGMRVRRKHRFLPALPQDTSTSTSDEAHTHSPLMDRCFVYRVLFVRDEWSAGDLSTLFTFEEQQTTKTTTNGKHYRWGGEEDEQRQEQASDLYDRRRIEMESDNSCSALNRFPSTRQREFFWARRKLSAHCAFISLPPAPLSLSLFPTPRSRSLYLIYYYLFVFNCPVTCSLNETWCMYRWHSATGTQIFIFIFFFGALLHTTPHTTFYISLILFHREKKREVSGDECTTRHCTFYKLFLSIHLSPLRLDFPVPTFISPTPVYGMAQRSTYVTSRHCVLLDNVWFPAGDMIVEELLEAFKRDTAAALNILPLDVSELSVRPGAFIVDFTVKYDTEVLPTRYIDPLCQQCGYGETLQLYWLATKKKRKDPGTGMMYHDNRVRFPGRSWKQVLLARRNEMEKVFMNDVDNAFQSMGRGKPYCVFDLIPSKKEAHVLIKYADRVGTQAMEERNHILCHYAYPLVWATYDKYKLDMDLTDSGELGSDEEGSHRRGGRYGHHEEDLEVESDDEGHPKYYWNHLPTPPHSPPGTARDELNFHDGKKSPLVHRPSGGPTVISVPPMKSAEGGRRITLDASMLSMVSTSGMDSSRNHNAGYHVIFPGRGWAEVYKSYKDDLEEAAYRDVMNMMKGVTPLPEPVIGYVPMNHKIQLLFSFAGGNWYDKPELQDNTAFTHVWRLYKQHRESAVASPRRSSHRESSMSPGSPVPFSAVGTPASRGRWGHSSTSKPTTSPLRHPHPLNTATPMSSRRSSAVGHSPSGSTSATRNRLRGGNPSGGAAGSKTPKQQLSAEEGAMPFHTPHRPPGQPQQRFSTPPRRRDTSETGMSGTLSTVIPSMGNLSIADPEPAMPPLVDRRTSTSLTGGRRRELPIPEHRKRSNISPLTPFELLMASSRTGAGASSTTSRHSMFSDYENSARSASPLPPAEAEDGKWKLTFAGDHWGPIIAKYRMELGVAARKDLSYAFVDSVYSRVIANCELDFKEVPKGMRMICSFSEQPSIEDFDIFSSYKYPEVWKIYEKRAAQRAESRDRGLDGELPSIIRHPPSAPSSSPGAQGDTTMGSSQREEGATALLDTLKSIADIPKLNHVNWKYQFPGRRWKEVIDAYEKDLYSAAKEDITDCVMADGSLNQKPYLEVSFEPNDLGGKLTCKFVAKDTDERHRRLLYREKFRKYKYPKVVEVYKRRCREFSASRSRLATPAEEPPPPPMTKEPPPPPMTKEPPPPPMTKGPPPPPMTKGRPHRQ
eukprot:gene10640-7388_t